MGYIHRIPAGRCSLETQKGAYVACELRVGVRQILERKQQSQWTKHTPKDKLRKRFLLTNVQKSLTNSKKFPGDRTQ